MNVLFVYLVSESFGIFGNIEILTFDVLCSNVSTSRLVWIVINYGLNVPVLCRWFKRMKIYTLHTHTHTRQKVVIVYFFFAILLIYAIWWCCIIIILGKRTIINFSSLSICSWAGEKNTSQTMFRRKKKKCIRIFFPEIFETEQKRNV